MAASSSAQADLNALANSEQSQRSTAVTGPTSAPRGAPLFFTTSSARDIRMDISTGEGGVEDGGIPAPAPPGGRLSPAEKVATAEVLPWQSHLRGLPLARWALFTD